MNKAFRFLILTVALFCVGQVAFGASYFVTQSGSGSADGTFGNPADIAKYNAGTEPFDDLSDDTVYFSGEFTTALNTPNGGSSGHWVVLDLSDAIFSVAGQNQIVIDQAYIKLQNAQQITVYDVTAPTGIYITGANAWIDNCTISGAGASITNLYSYGIRLFAGGADTKITRCKISHLNTGINIIGTGATGFSAKIGGERGMGNIVSDIDAPLLSDADGISVSSTNATIADFTGLVISYNTVSEWGDDGIDLYYANNAIVEYNTIGPLTGSDAGITEGNGIKCGRSGGSGNIIRGNYIHTIYSTSVNATNYGITSNGSDNLTIVNNVVDNARYGLIILIGTSGHIVANNSIVNSRLRAASLQDNVTAIIQNNIFWGDGTDGRDLFLNAGDVVTGGYNIFRYDTTHSESVYTNTATSDKLSTNPLFVSSTNFKLLPNSPAIDSGTPITGLHTSGSNLITGGDAAGNTKLYGKGIDIGAYEMWQGRKQYFFDFFGNSPIYYTVP